jgi:hypothetical protein
MLSFRISGGAVHELPYNPAALFQELAAQLQYQMDTAVPLAFYLRGQPLSMTAQVSDVPIRATDYITVLRPSDPHGHATSARGYRETRALPPRDELPDLAQEPPDLSEKVGVLMELGAGLFSVEQCQAALRSAFYNPDRATMYLFAAPAPEPREHTAEGRSPIAPGDADVVQEIAEETSRDPRIVAQVYIMANRDRDNTYRTLMNLPEDDD